MKKGKARLVVRFEIWMGGFLLFQVLDQTGIPLGSFEFKASNGIQVISENFPAIAHNKDRIWLRGNRSTSNNEIAMIKFNTEEEAINSRNKFLEALQEAVDSIEYDTEPIYEIVSK